MATTIRLEHLWRQGVPDELGSTFSVSREKYEELPILPENKFEGDEWVVEEVRFREVFRGSNKRRPAVRLYNPNDLIKNDPDILDNQVYWILLWIEEEGIWICFEYWNFATVGESYGSTVEVNVPYHGDIYRMSEETKNIVKMFYDFG